MMRKIFFFSFLAFIFCIEISAQTGAAFYRSADNIYYWKNRMPYEGYWQQDVYYNIKANIDEKTDILTGNEELTYWNNSPDTLNCIYFHLYQNAFQPESYYDALMKSLGQTPYYGIYEMRKWNIKVESISSDSKELKTETDNTILKVILEKPLLSGESVTFKIKFKTYFDIAATWRRMRVFYDYGFKHYNGAHWYPRICVYDRVFGWETGQHLGHEFYGDFGAYDVELTFANNFIVDATGILQNENEVLPDTLKAKLYIKNFKDKPLYETPSIIIPYDSTQKKTWKFHADNVHDFAFLADPFFRIGTAQWNGINCIALAMESNASKWQNAAEYTAKVIKFYSENFGMYCYPKIIVSDAQSGMEYPMLTMDSGLDPDYKYILAHEVGHNWFFGQVGNNETYRAALDEGFTQLITTSFLDTLIKSEPIETPIKSGHVRHFTKTYSPVDRWAYFPYYENAMKTDGVQLNTHSDMFGGSFPYSSFYRQTYSKTATMLYNLKYVLGDSLFSNAMKYYFDKWKFAHPYLQDFRDAFTEYTNTDLTWFFDEWLETNKTIDYAVTSVKKNQQNRFF
ncbi:MAG: M1 family metallopeptidase [Bacteroidota bacterium]